MLPKMSDKVRFGIIGCGVIAPWHARGIGNAADAELTAVCDIERPKAQKLADEFGSPAVFDNHHDLLDSGLVDAVSVCVPSGLHAKIGIDAAQAGKHILSEKPIDITLQNIDALITAARDCNVKLACIFQRRTAPLWQTVREAILAGKIGKLILADAYLKYYRSQEYYDSAGWRGTWALDGGGALMNQGVHCVDLMRWIAGDPVIVYARCDHLARNIEVEDTSAAVITYANGAIGIIEGTTSVYKGMPHRLEFHGDTGNILVEGERIVRWETVDGNEAPDLSAPPADGSATADPADIGTEGHRIQIQDLARAIIEDRDPMITGEQARGAVELILGIYESSRTGAPVQFPL